MSESWFKHYVTFPNVFDSETDSLSGRDTKEHSIPGIITVPVDRTPLLQDVIAHVENKLTNLRTAMKHIEINRTNDVNNRENIIKSCLLNQGHEIPPTSHNHTGTSLQQTIRHFSDNVYQLQTQ